MNTSTRSIIEQYLAAYQSGNTSDLSRIVAPEFTDHGFPTFSGGPGGVRQAIEALHTHYGRLSVVLEECVCEGDQVAFRFLVTGTHTGAGGTRASVGQRTTWSGAAFARLHDGKLAELWRFREENVAFEGSQPGRKQLPAALAPRVKEGSPRSPAPSQGSRRRAPYYGGQLASRLLGLRKSMGLAQDTVAKATGLSVGAISRLERSLRSLRVDLLVAWAGALGYRVELIFWQPATPSGRWDPAHPEQALGLDDACAQILADVAAGVPHMPEPARRALMDQMQRWKAQAAPEAGT